MSKFTIDIQHIDFFREEGFLELEDLISKPLYEELRKDLIHFDDTNIRHLSRRFDSFKKLSKNRTIQSLALELTRKSTLKYGLDLLITEKMTEKEPEPIYFRQMFSYTGIALGLFINLSSFEKEETEQSLFPSKPQSGIFFKPNSQVDFSKLQNNEKYLLMIFCFEDSRYKDNPFDPFTREVIQEKKSFGDKISEAFHPLIHK